MPEEDGTIIHPQEASRILETLTAGQKDVLDLVALHQTSKEIARELGISPSTVDQRIKFAKEKLGAFDRASAVRKYSALKRICGQTIYEPPYIDGIIDLDQTVAEEPLIDSTFEVRDAGFTVGSKRELDVGTERPILEAMDIKFGRLGRIGAVVAFSAMIAVTTLIITSVSVTLNDLF